MASVGSVLSSPVWPVVIPLVAIAVSIALFHRGRSRRQLTYRTSARSLLRVGSEVAGQVRITYRDEVVQRVHLVSATLTNRGNTPILPVEFEQPLSISLPGTGKLLTASIGEVRPADLKPTLRPDQEEDGAPRLMVSPLLLNPGDTFTASAMVADYAGSVLITGRIAGIARLTEEPDQAGRPWWRAASISAAMATAAVALGSSATAIVGFLYDKPAPASHPSAAPHRVLENPYYMVRLPPGRPACARFVSRDGSRVILQVKGRSTLVSVPVSALSVPRLRRC